MSDHPNAAPERGEGTAIHASEFVRDEMEARGWDADELATRMCEKPEDFGVARLSLDLLLNVRDPHLHIGELAAWLARAFGTSATIWTKLDESWRAAQSTPTPSDAREGEVETVLCREDGEWRAVEPRHPGLSFFAPTREAALLGLVDVLATGLSAAQEDSAPTPSDAPEGEPLYRAIHDPRCDWRRAEGGDKPPCNCDELTPEAPPSPDARVPGWEEVEDLVADLRLSDRVQDRTGDDAARRLLELLRTLHRQALAGEGARKVTEAFRGLPISRKLIAMLGLPDDACDHDAYAAVESLRDDAATWRALEKWSPEMAGAARRLIESATALAAARTSRPTTEGEDGNG